MTPGFLRDGPSYAGGEEAVAVDELMPAVPAPRPARLALHVVEGDFD
jgi:hypothetical protein